MMEDVLGFCALVLTVLMLLGVCVWFCCSIVESVIKMRRRLKTPRQDALLRQNKRLKSFLVDAVEENFLLRKGYHLDVLRRKSNHLNRNAA